MLIFQSNPANCVTGSRLRPMLPRNERSIEASRISVRMPLRALTSWRKARLIFLASGSFSSGRMKL